MADRIPPAGPSCREYHRDLFGDLERSDSEIRRLIAREYERLQDTIQLVAAENRCSRAVLGALGSIVQNKTTEGTPGKRLHGGCAIVDRIEQLAVARAKRAFGAKYANVQPHSGTTANQIVLAAVLNKGDRILSMATLHGGHFSHGYIDSLTAKLFHIEEYCVDRETLLLDYERIAEQARRFRPRLLICGASAYTRIIDFAELRKIADKVGAYLLADVSHISSLIIAGAHPSPIDYAHFTTTSTYKPGGPRGGLILMGNDFDTRVNTRGGLVPLWKLIDKTTFPGLQGTPYLNNIAGKAVFFREMLSRQYKVRQFKIIENAKRLAANLVSRGYCLLTGGTDNHMLLVNVAKSCNGLTGLIAQKALEECGIVTDKMLLPYDAKGPDITSGLRLGTPIVTRNGMGLAEMDELAEIIDAVLKRMKPLGDSHYRLDGTFTRRIRRQTKTIASKFPMR